MTVGKVGLAPALRRAVLWTGGVFLLAGLVGCIPPVKDAASNLSGFQAPPSPPSSPSVAKIPRFLYVNTGFASIGRYAIDPNSGALSGYTTLPTGSITEQNMIADPAGQFLYTTHSTSPNFGVSKYSVNQSTGALTLASSATFGTFPSSLAVDPSGQHVFAADNALTTGQVGYFSAGGALTLINSAGSLQPRSRIVVDATGVYIFTPDQGTGSTDIGNFLVSGGLLAPNAPATSPFATAQGGFAINAAGTVVYASSTSAVIGCYSVTTGVATSISGGVCYPVLGTAALQDLAVDQSGKYLYGVNSAGSSILTFVLAANGAVTSATPSQTLAVGNAIVYLTTEPSGKFLYGVEPPPVSCIQAYTINSATGQLTGITGSPFCPTGASPARIAIVSF